MPVMNQYEAMFLYGPSASTDLDGATKNVRALIEKHGGEILVLKKWDERKLAYEINKQKRGTYIICYYKGPGSSVAAINREVHLSEEILRVMVLRADHLSVAEMEKVEPQPIQPREERNPWDRPYGEDRRRDDRPRDDRPRDDRPRDDRPRDDRAPRPAPRREEVATGAPETKE